MWEDLTHADAQISWTYWKITRTNTPAPFIRALSSYSWRSKGLAGTPSTFQFELTLKKEEKENALEVQGSPGLLKTTLAGEEIIVSAEQPSKIKGHDWSGKGRR